MADDRTFRTFLVVWAGQLVSTLGSGLSGFAVAIWVYLETGSATALSILAVAQALPGVVLAPLAGSVADRNDRRRVMLLADAGGAAGTAILAVLFFTGRLELWSLALVAALGGAANTFQDPALRSSLGVLVPTRHFGRAGGLLQLNEAASVVATPVLAGAAVATVGLGGVALVDAATFLVAVGTLAAVRFPPTPHAAGGAGAERKVRADTAMAWEYLRTRPGLLVLLGTYAALNFLFSFTNPLYPALILPFGSEVTLGAVMSAAGAGMLLGSLVASVWAGPRRKVLFMTGAFVAIGVLLALQGLRPSALLIGSTAFLLLALVPAVNATSQSLWLTKVEPAVQGRVFSLRRMIAQVASPLGLAMAGPLADRVFEPAMDDGGSLAGSLGRVIGTGPGRGVGLMLIVTGLVQVAVGIAAFAAPRLRNLERDIPDAGVSPVPPG
jgi:MFS family permease